MEPAFGKTDSSPLPSPAPPRQRVVLAIAAVIILVGVGLKIWLLFTSQSLADGDEAVEGVMALHILDRGEHPLYPYGISYGAGAGVEAHVAALFFSVAGSSDVTLKAVGLCFWTGTLVLLGLLGRQVAGPRAALVAILLFAVAPSGPQWGLKVAGGHQVAVFLNLLVAWLALRERGWALALLLAPAAVFAHPIVAPFIAGVCASILWNKMGARRLQALLVLAGAAGVWTLLLLPSGRGYHDPSSTELALGDRLRQVPQLALGLFGPNLNSPEWPSGLTALIAGLWLGVYGLAMVWLWRMPSWWLYALAPWAVLALVHPLELAPRHLLLLMPLSCLFLGVWADRCPRLALAAVPLLAITGIVVHVRETKDPFIYGPGGQYLGVERANVRELVRRIELRGARHVYCADEMLAWDLMFASRGRLLVRSKSPRLPEIGRQVDEARLGGQPVALIVANRQRPVRFGVIFNPNPKIIEAHFPVSASPRAAR